jgi:hypothetical protein
VRADAWFPRHSSEAKWRTAAEAGSVSAEYLAVGSQNVLTAS